jgi:hypothetical protein
VEQESFRLLGESADVRIGVRSVEGTETGIEVLVRLVSIGATFDPRAVRVLLERLETLMGRGYQINVQEGWWVVCEKVVSEQEAAAEGRTVIEMFAPSLSRT